MIVRVFLLSAAVTYQEAILIYFFDAEAESVAGCCAGSRCLSLPERLPKFRCHELRVGQTCGKAGEVVNIRDESAAAEFPGDIGVGGRHDLLSTLAIADCAVGDLLPLVVGAQGVEPQRLRDSLLHQLVEWLAPSSFHDRAGENVPVCRIVEFGPRLSDKWRILERVESENHTFIGMGAVVPSEDRWNDRAVGVVDDAAEVAEELACADRVFWVLEWKLRDVGSNVLIEIKWRLRRQVGRQELR